jgi:hypothetical protein
MGQLRGTTNQGWFIVVLHKPMLNMNIVRVILSLTANYGWGLQQFDVKNAFLHGDLEE